METFNEQLEQDKPCNFDINTAAELLTSLQHGRDTTIRFYNREKQDSEEDMESHSRPGKSHEELAKKTETTQEQTFPTKQDDRSTTTNLTTSRTTVIDSCSNQEFSKPVVSTPVPKRARPSSGFEAEDSSVQKRQQRMSNMLAFEWYLLQQLKWYPTRGNNYNGWLSAIPYCQHPYSWNNHNAVASKTGGLTPKSCKGRPPSELPLSRMRFKALQQACIDRGISPNGTVAALKQRLRDWISIKMTGKPSVPQQRKRRIENEHSVIQDYKAFT